MFCVWEMITTERIYEIINLFVQIKLKLRIQIAKLLTQK